ncbi:MAG: hypothetical protein JWP95_1721 [Actinotalea sp.]|nr:hypothetical protein [Actinotalea sp.]
MTISPCSRTGPIRAAVPSADGCEARPATSGTMGGCDSSPEHHAAAHHARTGHPLVQSVEPDEEWCRRFEDAIALEVAGLTSRAHT